MTNVNEALHVGIHQRRRHGQECAVGSNLVKLKLFDIGKEIIPPAAIETERMSAEFVENFLHLKGSRNGFEEDRGPNGSNGYSKILLCRDKNIVPETCFQVGFELWKVKVGTRSLGNEVVDVVEKVETEIDERTGCDTSIDCNVTFLEMPSTWTNKEDSRLFLWRVDLASDRIGVGNGSTDSVTQVDLSLHEVTPSGAGRVLTVSHVDIGTTIQAVDHHFSIYNRRADV